MGITPNVLPDASASVGYAFSVAMALVNPQLNAANPLVYTLAVYNLAGSNLLNWAPDQGGSTYFADIRKTWNMNAMVPGVINSASDEGTSASMTVGDNLTNLTFNDLQLMKDPYGRQYLAFAQMVGSLWGLS